MALHSNAIEIVEAVIGNEQISEDELNIEDAAFTITNLLTLGSLHKKIQISPGPLLIEASVDQSP